MPEPIRTHVRLPPTILLDDHTDCKYNESTVVDTHVPIPEESQLTCETKFGMSFKSDPFGRDKPRHSSTKAKWSAGPLAKHLRGVVWQIDSNIQNKITPSAEKLDAFVSRVVANAHRQMRLAPRKVRTPLQSMFGLRFQKFWDFARNEKVRGTTPEELKSTLLHLIEGLVADFGANQETLVQVRSMR